MSKSKDDKPYTFVVYRSHKCGWRSENRFPYTPEDKSTFAKFANESETECPKCGEKELLQFSLEKVYSS